MDLWLKEHSEFAKEQVFLNNVGLIWDSLKSLNLNIFDEDLFQVGAIGFLKALYTYKTEKEFLFSTYANKCIKNEILSIFRKKKEVQISFSLDEPLKNGEGIFFFDMIPDNNNYYDDVLFNCSIEDGFNVLSENEIKVISLLKEGKTQRQIGKIMGISQPETSRILKRACKKFKNQLMI